MGMNLLLLMETNQTKGMKKSSKLLRLEGWDYRTPWYYFITICTKDREHYFGEIRNGKIGLTGQGCAAWYFWNQISNHFPTE